MTRKRTLVLGTDALRAPALAGSANAQPSLLLVGAGATNATAGVDVRIGETRLGASGEIGAGHSFSPRSPDLFTSHPTNPSDESIRS